MSIPGQCWRHGIIGTLGSWLPGSPKGWRSRNHKLHSSGDYKQPPPEDEHAGLYAYSKRLRPEGAVVIPIELRPLIGKAFRDELIRSHQVLAVSVSGRHCHFLARLPVEKKAMQATVGHAKRKSSRAIKAQMPGRIWAAGGKFIVIDDPDYHRRVYRYILQHAKEGAWVWSFRDAAEG